MLWGFDFGPYTFVSCWLVQYGSPQMYQWTFTLVKPSQQGLQATNERAEMQTQEANFQQHFLVLTQGLGRALVVSWRIVAQPLGKQRKGYKPTLRSLPNMGTKSGSPTLQRWATRSLVRSTAPVSLPPVLLPQFLPVLLRPSRIDIT